MDRITIDTYSVESVHRAYEYITNAKVGEIVFAQRYRGLAKDHPYLFNIITVHNPFDGPRHYIQLGDSKPVVVEVSRFLREADILYIERSESYGIEI